jgi:aspartate aminotransferase-like enzyme
LTASKLLSINSGKFGERFGKIALSHGIANVEIKHEWDTPATVEEVQAALNAHPDIDAIALQVCESAGGLRHSVEAIASAVKAHNPSIMVIADGITAVGVEKIDITNIDCLISGSQKALMLPPGLAIMGLSNTAIEKIGSGKGYYFNLATEIKNQRKNTTAWTAATTITIGLESILNRIKAEGGLDKLYADTARRAQATREAMIAIGLSLYPINPANSMTTVGDAQAKQIRSTLKAFDVNVAGGQDHIKDSIFRINHMGLIAPHEAAWAANAVELALDKMGRRAYDGTASRVFNTVYFGL